MPKSCHRISEAESVRCGADNKLPRFMPGLLFPGPDALGLGAAIAQRPGRPTAARGRLGGVRLQAQALVLALGAAATVNGQAVRPEQADPESGRARAPVVRTGVAIHRGQELHFEIIDGLAVHGGDMVLGSVEDLAVEHRRQRATKPLRGSWPERRDLAAVEDEFLWPDGVIPYVIEPGFTDKGLSNIGEAIRAWNSNTVVTLVQRTTESDYVRFLPRGLRSGEPYCRADLGRKGGEQSIWLRSPDGCPVDSTIHEIGHAVGLRHEHQRHDRDRYVTVSDAKSYGDNGSAYRANAPGRRPYDYSSIMHYRTLETIPLGFPSEGRRCRRETSTEWPGCTERFRQLLRLRRTPRG